MLVVAKVCLVAVTQKRLSKLLLDAHMMLSGSLRPAPVLKMALENGRKRATTNQEFGLLLLKRMRLGVTLEGLPLVEMERRIPLQALMRNHRCT